MLDDSGPDDSAPAASFSNSGGSFSALPGDEGMSGLGQTHHAGHFEEELARLYQLSRDDARKLAVERYPAIAPYLTRKLDQHRADAFLIAVYGAKVMDRDRDLEIPD